MSRWPTWAHTGQLSLLCLPGIQNRLEGRHSLWSCTDTLFTGKSWVFFSPLRIIRVSHQAQAGSNNPFWHRVWRKCLTARAEQCSGWNVRSREWVQKTTHVITLLKYVGWIWGRCSVLSSLWEYTEVFPISDLVTSSGFCRDSSITQPAALFYTWLNHSDKALNFISQISTAHYFLGTDFQDTKWWSWIRFLILTMNIN